tara:strand:+ start:10082 stop:10573 length:492 start_codon:yes stop_codon:yes gene_type:complete
MLGPDDESAFLSAVSDWEGEDLAWLTFDWDPTMSHEQHLKILSDHHHGINLPSDFVASTMLYGFVGDKIIGRVHVRHTLNDNLLKRGGHMGYAVSPRFRGHGYGLSLAKAGLEFLTKNLKVKDVLITCDEKNNPSIKIIEALGAKLENTVPDAKGVPTRRYWL